MGTPDAAFACSLSSMANRTIVPWYVDMNAFVLPTMSPVGFRLCSASPATLPYTNFGYPEEHPVSGHVLTRTELLDTSVQ